MRTQHTPGEEVPLHGALHELVGVDQPLELVGLGLQLGVVPPSVLEVDGSPRKSQASPHRDLRRGRSGSRLRIILPSEATGEAWNGGFVPFVVYGY